MVAMFLVTTRNVARRFRHLITGLSTRQLIGLDMQVVEASRFIICLCTMAGVWRRTTRPISGLIGLHSRLVSMVNVSSRVKVGSVVTFRVVSLVLATVAVKVA